MTASVPGADNVEQFWRVLEQGENHVVEIPKERWNNDAFFDTDVHAVGKSYVKRAGLLKDPKAFDNKLFNINDFEADQMDPQQRFVLECCFMAMEDAGITREQLAGSNTGVYVGAMNGDYRALFTAKSPIVGNYTVTGISNSIISARVSFTFDLRGPSMTLDTACSSALVAIHVGAQALRTGDCDLALCGGTNFLMSPDVFVHLSKAHMVSPTGQCFAFSDSADGYTRGEGCGMVILKRLKDALRDGDHIWATIETGSNQDGHSVTPISAPSGDQQLRLLETVYQDAAMDLEGIDYIEAHGTGTSAGDPVEAKALGTFFRSKGTTRQRYIGSVKTNVGHLESAAGTAGLIKVLLMMKHSKIAPSLFFDRPNPKIDFPDLNLQVPTKAMDWPRRNKIACVNSFGFGGTNCHAVVKAFVEHDLMRRSSQSEVLSIPCIVCFSAKHEKSLKGSIEDFVQHPEVSSLDVHDVSYTSTVRRDHYNIRFACVIEDMSELLSKLNDHIQKGEKGIVANRRAKAVFVFCGMGTTWKGMCKEMLDESSAFRDAIVQIDEYLCEYVSWSLITRFEQESYFDDPEFSPIAIFACQVGLGRVWASLGVTPACVVGQSVGEVAAAFFAGILSLRDAVKIVYFRTTLMAKVIGGKMVIVRNMLVSKVKEVVKNFQGLANVSLEYSPVACAVSGNNNIITQVKQELQSKARSIGAQIQLIDLQVPVAYHSHHVDGCKEDLKQALSDITPNPPDVDMISSVLAEPVMGPLDADYWVSNMREPVRFYEAVQKTVTKGSKNVYIEIGPKPVLRAHSGDIFPQDIVVPIVSMYKQPEWKIFLQAVVSLYEQGFNIKWKNLPTKGTVVTCIPRYSFNPRRVLQLCESAHMILSGVHYMRKEHPFVYKVDTTNEFKTIITALTFPSVYDHIVSGMLIIPGALYAEIGFAVAMHNDSMDAPLYSVSVRFEQPCSFSRDGAVELDIEVKPSPAKGVGVEKYQSYKLAAVQGNKTFANIHLQAHNMPKHSPAINIRHIEARCTQMVKREEIYDSLKSFGFTYGPGYSLLMYALKSSQECLAKIFVPRAMFMEIGGTTIHPSILDGMVQTSVLLMNTMDEARDLLPRSIGKLTCYRPTEEEMYIYTTLKCSDRTLTLYDIKLTTLWGEVIADLEDLAIKSLTDKSDAVQDMYRCYWKLQKSNYTGEETKEPKALYVTDSVPEGTPTALMKRCLVYDPQEQTSDYLQNTLDTMLKNTAEPFELIIFLPNLKMDDSEDAYDVHTKILNSCMLLKFLYKYAFDKSLTIPLCLFTQRAFLPEDVTTETENVNPLMTALWGMTRCVLKEQIYTNFASVDLHLPEGKLCLDFVTSITDLILSDEALKGYPEFMVTEKDIFVNQFIAVEPDTVVPTFRHNFADTSQNVIFLSREPSVLTDSFAVYHKPQEKVEQASYISIDVSTTAFQSPLLYNMTMLYSTMEKRISQKGNGYPLFALENIGTGNAPVNGKKQTDHKVPLISCYPVPTGTKIKVPASTTVTADMIPDYVPGDLSRLVLLWCLQDLVLTPTATILASSATAKFGEALLCMLMSRRKPKPVQMNLVVVEELNNVESMGETVVSLVLTEETVVPILAKRWPMAKHFITVSSLLQDSARAPIAFFLPSVQVDLLDTNMVFHPQNLASTVPKVKKWMRKHASLMNRVAGCLHKAPSSYPVFKTAVSDLDELLEVQIIQMKSPLVRMEKSELFRQDAIYIVVGGLTGLGWLFVKFLSSNGAGNIAILNRRQASAEQNKDIEDLITAEDCNIKAFQGDVTNLDSLKTSFKNMLNSFRGSVIKGVFFGAAVVNDQLLVDVDPKTFSKVLAPKVMGVWNLHQLTKDLPLDYFIMHSSITSALGNAGQANYGAGNAFMDGIAHYRRHKKLSGQSINWGALDTGILSNYTEAKKFLENQGFILMTEEDITAVIIPILLLDWAQIVPCTFDEEILVKRVKRDMLVPFQYRLMSMLGSATEEVKIEEDILLALKTARELPPDQRVDVYERYVTALATQVLSAEDGTIKTDTSLIDIGMDSIVGMTMINQIYKELHCRLPAIVFITNDPTVRSIAQAIDDVLSGKMAEGSEFGPDMEQLAIAAAENESGDAPMKKEEVPALPAPPEKVKSFTASVVESSQLVIYKRHPRKSYLHGIVDVELPKARQDPEALKLAIIKVLEMHPAACFAFKEDSSKRNTIFNFEKKILSPEEAMDFRVMPSTEENLQQYCEEVFEFKGKGPMRFIMRQGNRALVRIVFHKAVFDFRSVHSFVKDLSAILHSEDNKPPTEKIQPDKYIIRQDDLSTELNKVYKSKSEALTHFWAKTLNHDVGNTSLKAHKIQYPPKPLEATNAAQRILLSPDLTRKLTAFIRTHKVSLLGIVASCYQILLHVLTGKSTLSLIFPVDLRRFNKDISGNVGNFSNEIPLPVTLDSTTKLTLVEFIVANNNKVQQHIDHGMLPFTYFQSLAERVMEVFHQSPHGICIEMTSPENIQYVMSKTTHQPPVLPIGMETNLFVQHHLHSGIVSLDLGYKTCLMSGAKAEVLLKNMAALLTCVVDKPKLQLGNMKKYTDDLDTNFDTKGSCTIL
ncbi:mycocerosic acid synthase-like [Aplysia californica]|uniref:Fatty acid synthase n=1 Tax=Aplysia californica TaxID=6500 RepID=A0ABM1A1C0_APLCA|nr:mycocerosic acid synthase-like [Aplysia californica]